MPVIPANVRRIREALLRWADERNIILSEELDNTELFESYEFVIPGDIQVDFARLVVSEVTSLCGQGGLKCYFSISIHLLPEELEPLARAAFVAVFAPDMLYLNTHEGLVDIWYDGGPMDPETAEALLGQLVAKLSSGFGVHLAIYLQENRG